MMAGLSSGEILAIIISLVLFVVAIAAIYICRLVYLHEHDSHQVKDQLKKRVMRKMRSTTSSTDSIISGSTDHFVDRRDFEQMFSGMGTPWKTSVDDIEEAMSGGELRIDNPMFDEERGRVYAAAVTIQSAFRGYRLRTLMRANPKQRPQGQNQGCLVQMRFIQAKSFGITPTGKSTTKESALEFLAKMRKKNAGKSMKRYRQICLMVSGKSLKVLLPNKQKISHSMSLRNILSYTVDATNSQLFGVIFSRKGLNYCLGVICTGNDADFLFKSLEEANLLQQLHALSLTQQSVLETDGDYYEKRDSRQSVTELLATLPGGEEEARRSAKQTEREVLAGSSFRNSLSSSHHEETVAVGAEVSARSTLKAHKEMSEEDLLAATHQVLEETLQNNDKVISSMKPQKDQVVDLVLSDSTMGLLEDERTPDGSNDKTLVAKQHLKDANEVHSESTIVNTNSTSEKLSSEKTDDSHHSKAIGNSQELSSPINLGEPAAYSTPLQDHPPNVEEGEDVEKAVEISRTIQGLLNFGETPD